MEFVFALFVMLCGSLVHSYALVILGIIGLVTTAGAYNTHRRGGKASKGGWKAFKLSTAVLCM
ncbi:MAG: hypothetical protein K2X81_25955, partial [Candidatus Obscuribacterales bacterium]|nr:hypothetical protein [Candidatus Obscuribacterales bacterium]